MHPFQIFRLILAVSVAWIFQPAVFSQNSDYPIRPVDFTQVKISSGFWKSRLDAVAKVTIPFAFRKCEETGRIDNFIYAGGLAEGKFQGDYGFNDSDVFKIMEGAAYSLMNESNPELESYLDTLVSYVSAAQEEDGYLYTAWTLGANDYADLICCSYDPRGQFFGSRWSHELYNVGHMYEAAVAHHLATGSRNFLDVATRNADLIHQVCLVEGRPFYPGHQEIEIGLVKLYRATGKEEYLDLAKLFLDRRGTGLTQYENQGEHLHQYDIYSQDHKPVIEQDEAVGHAVRAGYMYAAMADIAALTGDSEYLEAIDRLWNNIVGKKIYITGGLGAGNGIEGFDKAYILPNNSYAETCAAIANIYWNHRMFLLHGDSKYIDILERTLYNGMLAGLSLGGDLFFYPNPLEFDGQFGFNQGANCRSSWFDCSCCPSNLSRFIPSVAGYVYATREDDLYVNLFNDNVAEIMVDGHLIKIRQTTNYPWSGVVKLHFEQDQPVEATLRIREPAWSLDPAFPSDLYQFSPPPGDAVKVRVNGKDVEPSRENGYLVLPGKWSRGQSVELDFPMEVRTITSHPLVISDQGKVAFQRGPILYCAEGVDNQGHALDLRVVPSSFHQGDSRGDLMDGVQVLLGSGQIEDLGRIRTMAVQLVPYYSWGHRDLGPMAVWLMEE